MCITIVYSILIALTTQNVVVAALNFDILTASQC